MPTPTEKIRKILQDRIKEGASQVQIAKEVVISQATVNKYLHTETKIGIENLKKICNAYDLDIRDIISEDQAEYRKKAKPPPFSEKEKKLIENYRAASNEIKNAAFDMLENSANQARGRAQEGAGHGSEQSA